MDRESVEAIITKSHPAAALRWSGSRKLAVSEDLKASASDFISFTADGALDRDGMPVWGDEALLAAVRQPLRVLSMPVADAGSGEPKVITTLLPGQTPLAISEDGQQVLAAESPYGLEESGDGPLAINPWLYHAGATPVDLTATLGRVHRTGFGADGRIWIVSSGVFYQAVDAGGRTVAEIKSDQITTQKYPPGWAISADGRVVAARPAGCTGSTQRPARRRRSCPSQTTRRWSSRRMERELSARTPTAPGRLSRLPMESRGRLALTLLSRELMLTPRFRRTGDTWHTVAPPTLLA